MNKAEDRLIKIIEGLIGRFNGAEDIAQEIIKEFIHIDELPKAICKGYDLESEYFKYEGFNQCLREIKKLRGKQ